MRILLVGDYPADPRLGSAKVYYKLREALAAAGHDCDVLLAPELGARPSAARLRWAAAPRLADRAIRRALRERGPYDVVDVASAEGWIFGARMRRSRAPVPAVVSRSHGLEHLNYRRMLDDARAGLGRKPLHRRVWYPLARLGRVAAAARAADALIVLNDADRAYAIDRTWLPPSRIHVVPHGVDDAFLAATPDAAPRGAGVLFCGSWDPVKGTPYLVKAMERLAAEGGVPALTVLGPGAAPEAVLDAFPADVRPRVTILPRADEAEVMRQYRRHDILVAPSTYEGFGMVVLEAMSQGLPVVATPVGCAPALLADGTAGRLVPARDPAALADAVRALMADDALRGRMGAAAAARVAGMSWRATAERTLEVYARAVARRAARSVA